MEGTPELAPGTAHPMSNTVFYGTQMPLFQITMNDQQRDALISADVLNEMTNQYWKPDGLSEEENLRDGNHERDGGKFVVKDGRVIEFTTACGESFSDIKYDSNGEVLSLRTSNGYVWEQRNTVGTDRISKRDGFAFKLSNLTLHYDRLIVSARGATHLNAGRPGYVSTIFIDGSRGTMRIGPDGSMSAYEITLPSGKTFSKSNVPMSAVS